MAVYETSILVLMRVHATSDNAAERETRRILKTVVPAIEAHSSTVSVELDRVESYGAEDDHEPDAEETSHCEGCDECEGCPATAGGPCIECEGCDDDE